MATFDEHKNQAEKNLKFLEFLNQSPDDHTDWQVTVCFYVVVHLANAHIAFTENQHYRSHSKVVDSLNPFGGSPSKLPEKAYTAYVRLRDLSRRSRYMVSDKPKNKGTNAFITNERHLAKALRHLNTFIEYFQTEYSVSIPAIQIQSKHLSSSENFKFLKLTSTTAQ